MRRFARSVSAVCSLAIVAGVVAPPATAKRARPATPEWTVARAAVVHGRDAGTAQRRPTSFEVFGTARPVTEDRASARAPAPRTPVPALGFDALADPNAVPADPTGALGHDYFFAAVNTQAAVYDRTGALVVPPIQLADLHSGSAGRFAFDPKVVYDQFAETFVLVYLVQSDRQRFSRIVAVAVPNATADDPGTWCATAFPGDLVPGKPRVWADYPGVGYNHDRVTIATNQFTFPALQGRFRSAQVISVSKAQLYDCAVPVVPDVFAGSQTADPNGLQAFTLQPAPTVDGSGPQHLLSLQLFDKRSYLVVWRIKNTRAGLRLQRATVGVGRTGLPPLGTQGGGSLTNADTYWDTGDERLIGAFHDVDDGALYAAHAAFRDLRPDSITGAYPESTIRWYEVRPARKLERSELVRRGTIGAPEVDAGWPSLATDADGTLFVTYSRASAVTGEFLSAWVAEVPPGMRAATQTLFAPGLATYDAIPGPERWGDFTAINRDPVTPTRLATFNQYAFDPVSWQQVIHVVERG